MGNTLQEVRVASAFDRMYGEADAQFSSSASLGISAIHLAAAVRDNGSGRVVTTELSAAKVATATTATAT